MSAEIIGRKVRITIDRPLGTYHPEHPALYYPVNYGYVAGVMAADGEEQDVYLLGVGEAVETFDGVVIAVVRRRDDVEDKWVAVPDGVTFTKEEITEAVAFQERFFDSWVEMGQGDL